MMLYTLSFYTRNCIVFLVHLIVVAVDPSATFDAVANASVPYVAAVPYVADVP